MHPLPFQVFEGFSATASLSLSSDGPIEPRLWDMAHAHDVAALRSSAPPARVGKVTLKPAAIVSIMATAIEKAAARSGTVERVDFRRLGLNDQQIDRHFAEAFLKATLKSPSLLSLAEVA